MPTVIDVGEKDYDLIEFSDFGVVNFGIYCHKYLFNSYDKDPYSEDNVFVFGTGPFAGGILPGTHRITTVFKSPLTHTLYVSTMGGAGYHLIKTGERLFCIKGRSENPVIIAISDEGIRFYEMYDKELEKIYFGEDFGSRALAKYSYKILKEFLGERFRVICVGPGAFKTDFGSICSFEVSRNGLKYDDFSGRGGGGSVLARAHNVVLIGFTGGKREERLNDVERIKEIFSRNGLKYPDSILKETKKYSYNEKIGSGGTFGSNYPLLKLWTPYNNWRMIYDDKNRRKEIFDIIIGSSWWEEFNREVVEKRNFENCGEPCPVKCKKYYKGIKVDYEPFEGLGPNIMLFEIWESKEIVSLVDSAGLDAIETGNIVSFLLEAEEKGIIEIYGNNVKEKAISVIRDFVEKGIEGNLRTISNGMDAKDIAVYVPYGEDGAITPNYYWSLGVLMPLPLSGRYWTNYKFGVFKDPEEFAMECYVQGVKESLYDDLGICRFHRKWIQSVMKDLLLEVSEFSIDPTERGRKILREIQKYNELSGAVPRIWDSERVKDIIVNLAKEAGSDWYKKFREDLEGSLEEYWERFWKEYNEFVRMEVVLEGVI